MSQPGVQPLPPPPPPARPPSKHNDPKYQAEKERQRRKEEERRKAYEKHKAEKLRLLEKQKAKQREKEKEKENAKKVPDPLGRLRRDTPFVCNIRFKNDLPEVPCDPKMLVEPLDPIKQSEFFITTLERNPRRDLILPPDLGIPIGLLNVERYQIPDDVPPLDPADAALLGEPTSNGPRSGGPTTEHAWLLKTTYISNDISDLRQRGYGQQQVSKPRTTAPVEELTAEQQISSIEEMFELVKRPPKHTKNPSLRPVEILSVFPDPDGWGLRHVLTSFDNDPMEELPQLVDLPPKLKKAKMERSVLAAKKTQVGPNGEEPQRFMALCLPKNVELPQEEEDVDMPVSAFELEGEYEWSKEYAYEMNNSNFEEEVQRNFLLRFKDDQALYTDLATRLSLKRRKIGQAAIPKPVKVDVITRLPTDQEEEEKRKRLQILSGEEEQPEAEEQPEEY